MACGCEELAASNQLYTYVPLSTINLKGKSLDIHAIWNLETGRDQTKCVSRLDIGALTSRTSSEGEALAVDVIAWEVELL